MPLDRVSVSLREPLKESIKILSQMEGRTISDMCSVLLDEAMDSRLSPRSSKGRPIKPSFPSPYIDKAGAEE